MGRKEALGRRSFARELERYFFGVWDGITIFVIRLCPLIFARSLSLFGLLFDIGQLVLALSPLRASFEDRLKFKRTTVHRQRLSGYLANTPCVDNLTTVDLLLTTLAFAPYLYSAHCRYTQSDLLIELRSPKNAFKARLSRFEDPNDTDRTWRSTVI